MVAPPVDELPRIEVVVAPAKPFPMPPEEPGVQDWERTYLEAAEAYRSLKEQVESCLRQANELLQ